MGRGSGLGRGDCQRLGAPTAQSEESVLVIARLGDESEPVQGGPAGRFGARRGMAARAGQAEGAGFGDPARQEACRRQRKRDGSCGQQG